MDVLFSRLKLALLVQKYSIDMTAFSTDEALEMALFTEGIKRQLAPGDPALLYYDNQQKDFENIAFFIEQISTHPDINQRDSWKKVTFKSPMPSVLNAPPAPGETLFLKRQRMSVIADSPKEFDILYNIPMIPLSKFKE